MTENVRRLYRSRTQRMIGGVCGGLGEYFDIDPTIVRLLFVVTAVAGGPGLLAYIIMLIVVPSEPEPVSAAGPSASS
jgi:phage shock protein PspC (stress-responsive transcriptional regulator)